MYYKDLNLKKKIKTYFLFFIFDGKFYIYKKKKKKINLKKYKVNR